MELLNKHRASGYLSKPSSSQPHRLIKGLKGRQDLFPTHQNLQFFKIFNLSCLLTYLLYLLTYLFTYLLTCLLTYFLTLNPHNFQVNIYLYKPRPFKSLNSLTVDPLTDSCRTSPISPSQDGQSRYILHLRRYWPPF